MVPTQKVLWLIVRLPSAQGMAEWDPSLSNSALVVWDMQPGIALKAFNLKEIVEKIKSLIDLMHSKGKLVIYTQTTGLPYEYQSRYAIYRTRRRGGDPKSTPGFLEGGSDWRLMEEFVPTKEDLVIKKYTPSLFVGTIVEQVMRNRQADCLILTGVSTEVGIETTARHAACLGFVPIVVEDAVGGGDGQAHKYALAVMRKMFEVRTTEEVGRAIQSGLPLGSKGN